MLSLPDFRVRQRDYLLEIARAITQELDLDKLLKRILIPFLHRQNKSGVMFSRLMVEALGVGRVDFQGYDDRHRFVCRRFQLLQNIRLDIGRC